MLNVAHRAQTALTVLAVGIAISAALLGWSAESCELAVDGRVLGCGRDWFRAAVYWVVGGLAAWGSWALGDAVLGIATELRSVHRAVQATAE